MRIPKNVVATISYFYFFLTSMISFSQEKIVVATDSKTLSAENIQFEWSIGEVTSPFGDGDLNISSFYTEIVLDISKPLSSVDFDGITIFPNPFLDVLQIKTARDVAFHYRIITSSGQKILAGKYYKDELINLSNLSTGVYFLELNSDNKRSKILKIYKKQ